jgi:hypothetical protein
MDVAALDAQVDIIDCSKTLELFGQVLCFKNDVCHRISSA